jgi:hypothetical protein
VSERTVTERQVREAMNKFSNYDHIIKELFPELPKVGEFILVWDAIGDGSDWRSFAYMSDDQIHTLDDEGCGWENYNYRRQTPAERGES